MDKDEVLTIEHLKALKDLWFGLHPAFDVELFRANNPFFELPSLTTAPNDNTHSNKINNNG